MPQRLEPKNEITSHCQKLHSSPTTFPQSRITKSSPTFTGTPTPVAVTGGQESPSIRRQERSGFQCRQRRPFSRQRSGIFPDRDRSCSPHHDPARVPVPRWMADREVDEGLARTLRLTSDGWESRALSIAISRSRSSVFEPLPDLWMRLAGIPNLLPEDHRTRTSP